MQGIKLSQVHNWNTIELTQVHSNKFTRLCTENTSKMSWVKTGPSRLSVTGIISIPYTVYCIRRFSQRSGPIDSNLRMFIKRPCGTVSPVSI